MTDQPEASHRLADGSLCFCEAPSPSELSPAEGPREPLWRAIEEVDNSWHDEGDHIEWDDERLPEALIALRKAYWADTDRLTNHEHDCECRDPKHPSHRHSFEHEHVVLHRHDHEHPTDGMVARRIENGAFATDRDALDRYWSRAEKDTSPPGPPDAPRRDYPEPMA